MKKVPIEKKNYASGTAVDDSKFTYNPELNKYGNVVLFPEKVAKAKKAVKHPSLQKLLNTLDKGQPQ